MPTPACDCAALAELRLSREAFTTRFKATKALAARLGSGIAHPDGEHSLHSCPSCGSHWQRAKALYFGTKPYFFCIPPVDQAAWLLSPFVDPDEVFAFVTSVDRFLDRTAFSLGSGACSHAGCTSTAIALSVHCLSHHVRALQAARLLARLPSGRWFGPYESLGPAAFERYLAEKQATLAAPQNTAV